MKLELTEGRVRGFLSAFKVHGEVSEVAALCRDWLVLHAERDEVSKWFGVFPNESLLGGLRRYDAMRERQLLELDEAMRRLRTILNSLPNGEIEIAREAWGNTNTRIVIDAIRAARAFLVAHEGKGKTT